MTKELKEWFEDEELLDLMDKFLIDLPEEVRNWDSLMNLLGCAYGLGLKDGALCG